MNSPDERAPEHSYFCANHPAEPARLRCTKYSKLLCDKCAVCQDPTIYCRFRTQCVVWELEKHRQ